MKTDSATPRPFQADSPATWLPLAMLALMWAKGRGMPIESPVELADSHLDMCRQGCPDDGVNACLQMCLDINPAARLAFALAWDVAMGVSG